jgi:hypothetical protein
MASTFSGPVPTYPEAHIGYRGLAGVKRQGRGSENLPLLSPVLQMDCSFFQCLPSVTASSCLVVTLIKTNTKFRIEDLIPNVVSYEAFVLN